jgi:hypothetical protein
MSRAAAAGAEQTWRVGQSPLRSPRAHLMTMIKELGAATTTAGHPATGRLPGLPANVTPAD